jgi:hypothetical protein
MIEISLAHGRRIKIMKVAHRPPSLLRWIVVKNLDLLEPAARIEPATF